MKLSVAQMMMLGSIGAVAIVYLAMMNWRRAVYAALIVALFEGAIRKWIFPQGSELVYFLKDIILGGAYLKFFMFPGPEDRKWRLDIPSTLITTVIIILVMAGALNPNIGSPLMAAYGLKIYLWYLPLGFMIPVLFRNETHMTNVLFRYSLLAIPICLLGLAQFVAPPDSWINTYAASEFAGVKNVATFGAGQVARARITGTFSYIGGHTVFVMFFFMLSLCLFMNLEDKRRWILLFGNLPLLLGNAFMTGSRATVFYLVLFAALIGAISAVTNMGKSRNTFFYVMIGLGVSIFAVTLVFDKAVTAFNTRRKTAGDSESGRAFYFLNAAIHAATTVDIVGFGIGTSHPATAGLRKALEIPQPKNPAPYYDTETGQVMGELGWIGFFMWYALRVMMLIHCWGAFRRFPPSLMRSLSFAFFLYHLLMLPGQMVLNHTNNVFLCASWGFCLIPKLQSLVCVFDTSLTPVNTLQPANLRFRGSKTPRLR
jgi:hypothetical protein